MHIMPSVCQLLAKLKSMVSLAGTHRRKGSGNDEMFQSYLFSSKR
jgi:hypothetical protein